MADADAEELTRQENLAYFQRVEQMLNEPDLAEDEENRDLFVGNVIAEIEGAVLRACCDTVCSRVLEKLLDFCSSENLRTLLRQAVPLVPRLLGDRCGSHVLQALLVKAAGLVELDDEPDAASLGEMEEGVYTAVPGEATAPITVIDYVARELQQHVGEYAVSTYGSHVLRAVIALLAGLPLPPAMRSKASRAYRSSWNKPENPNKPKPTPKNVPHSFTTMLANIATGIKADPQFANHLVHPTASPVVQSMLAALAARNPELAGEFCALILPVDGDADQGPTELQELITKQIGSHVIEKVIEVAPADLFFEIYTAHFRGKLQELSLHPYANFVVAKLLASVHSREHAGIMLDELITRIEDLFASNRAGVVVKMAEAAAKFGIRQKELVAALASSFHIGTSDEWGNSVRMFLTMAVADVFKANQAAAAAEGGKPKAHYDPHGARLVQALFKFEPVEIKPVVSSFVSFQPDEVKAMACDPTGSHVLEGFLQSDANQKKKTKVLKRLKGFFTGMACDKFGSHAVDKCWAASDLENKAWIAEELISNQDELKASFYGKMIWRNCRLENFNRNQDQWAESETNNVKKRKMFDEFFDNEGGDDLMVKAKVAKTEKNESDDEGSAAEDAPAPAAEEDEMDALFSTAEKVDEAMHAIGAPKGDRKSKKGSKSESESAKKSKKKSKKDKAGKLDEVFAAISASKTKGEKSKKSKKEKKEKKSKKSKSA